MTGVPSEDRRPKREVEALIGAKRSLRAELQDAPESQEQFFADLIRTVNGELAETRAEPGAARTGPSAEILSSLGLPFTAAFAGTVTVEVDHDDDGVRGPHVLEFTPAPDTPTLRVQFTPSSVDVVELPPIEMDPVETDFGTNTTTVRRVATEGGMDGSFDESTGHVYLPLSLFFENSLGSPVHETDAPAHFVLSTRGVSAPIGDYRHVDPTGAPLDSDTMELTVAAESMFEDISGRFKSSILGGRDVALVADGELTDIDGPPLEVPASVSFGPTAVGSSRMRVLPIENTTGSTVWLSVPTPRPGHGGRIPTFSWSPTGSRLLDPGEEFTLRVTFTPGAAEDARTTLTIDGSDSGAPHSATLRGRGVGGSGGGGGGGGPGGGGPLPP